MNKARYILAVSLLLCGLAASAQRGTERNAPVLTYDRVVRNNLWNDSRNVTGIRQDTVSRSYAELSGNFVSGGFRDTWEAARSWGAGAVTASIRHMGKISLKGSFTFRQTEGYDMCGSMFMNPGFYPVDVFEFTPGRKTRQTYSFDGGIAYDISDRWRIGAAMDFESANLAKRKDLRHTNWWLDMTVTPGFMYHKGDFSAGASYIMRKTSESVKAEQIGIAESSYYAFLDKGLMYGEYSVWNGSGLHLSEAGVNGFPVRDISHGAAVQMQYKGLFAEVEYLNRRGIIGEKEYIWFRFPGHGVNARLGCRHDRPRSVHFARIDFGWDGLGLDESVLEKVTENGVTNVYNHGSNRILVSETFSLCPEYEYVGKIMELKTGAGIKWKESMSSQMYPYACYEALMTWKADADLLFHIGRTDLRIRLACGGGEVSETVRMTDQESGVQTEPYRLQDWYDMHMEYVTATRMDAGLSLRYNFLKGIYIEAAGNWSHGFGLELLPGSGRTEASISIGYNF